LKYFLDTEFIEYPFTIDLISVGIVREDGRYLYCENSDCDLSKANDFVKKNVIPNLIFRDNGKKSEIVNHKSLKIKAPHRAIASLVMGMIGDDKPEIWGYYADYDWVVFCWLFGCMVDLPKGWPMYCRDLKQLADSLDKPRFEGPKGEHNALEDARWNKAFYEYLKEDD